MSLLIKGMEMPKNMTMRDYTFRVRQDGTAELIDRASGISHEVIDVPTPHGRLIDADRLIAVLKSTTAISQSDYGLFNHIVGLIEHQPTVIEAEG